MSKEESRNSRWAIEVAGMIAKRLSETLAEDSAHVAECSGAGALARGRVFALAAYHDQAVESYKEALTLDPNLHEAAARLVILCMRTNRAVQALATAMKLAAEAPDYEMREMSSDERISVFTLLGNALVLNGRTEDAIQAYEVARRKSSADTTAAARLAQLYLAKGEPKKAMTLASAFSDNPRFQDFSSVLKLGSTSEALLPSFRGESLGDTLQLDAHGRPLTIDGGARLASVVYGDDAWCGSLESILEDDATP